mmetsp:Transcript_1553/g.2934  ORF Transcript_1553/g.2934 Transcript_1553/m.2934 type:complete len:301 (-) Transcript_1553:1045-1947(-)
MNAPVALCWLDELASAAGAAEALVDIPAGTAVADPGLVQAVVAEASFRAAARAYGLYARPAGHPLAAVFPEVLLGFAQVSWVPPVVILLHRLRLVHFCFLLLLRFEGRGRRYCSRGRGVSGGRHLLVLVALALLVFALVALQFQHGAATNHMHLLRAFQLNVLVRPDGDAEAGRNVVGVSVHADDLVQAFLQLQILVTFPPRRDAVHEVARTRDLLEFVACFRALGNHHGNEGMVRFAGETANALVWLRHKDQHVGRAMHLQVELRARCPKPAAVLEGLAGPRRRDTLARPRIGEHLANV